MTVFDRQSRHQLSNLAVAPGTRTQLRPLRREAGKPPQLLDQGQRRVRIPSDHRLFRRQGGQDRAELSLREHTHATVEAQLAATPEWGWTDMDATQLPVKALIPRFTSSRIEVTSQLRNFLFPR